MSELEIARQSVVQASIHLANKDLIATHEDLVVALDALHAALSSPETTPASDSGGLRAAIEALTSWPRVQWWAYEVKGGNVTEDRVVIDRAAVLALVDRYLALPQPGEPT